MSSGVSAGKRTVADMIPDILESLPGDGVLRFYVLVPTPNTGTRIVDDPALKPIVEEALKLRSAYRVPFWEAVLLISRRDGVEVDAVLNAANHHQPMAELPVITVPVSEVDRSYLRDLLGSINEGSILALSSMITIRDSAPLHIPMLDFRIRPSAENLELALKIVSRAGFDGTVFDSGNSYHFYGDQPLEGDHGLGRFLGRMSLFAPFVDQRWIAHQLIEGACALRISPGKTFASSPIELKRTSAR